MDIFHVFWTRTKDSTANSPKSRAPGLTMGFCLNLSKEKVQVVSAAVVHVAVDEQQHVFVFDELAEGLAACVDGG